MSTSSDKYMEFVNLNKTYPTPKGPAVIVDGFNFTVKKGEFISILGHSGCGKSTVLSMVAGLNDISGGNITLDQREIQGPGPDRGVVFQSPCLLPWMTTYDNVMLGVKQVFPHATEGQRNQIVTYYLTKVGLADAVDKKPGELSQGMCQRVGLARAFALDPKVLLLDEPFGMLDSLTRQDLQDVLIELLSRNQKTAIMVTHDVDEAVLLSDRVLMMTNGPRAKVGLVVDIDFPRPRNREVLMECSQYFEYRAQLIEFLEEQEQLKEAPKVVYANKKKKSGPSAA